MKYVYILLGLLMATPFVGCTEKEELDNPMVTLTDLEKADLLFLREEEKLARDVYIYSAAKYGIQIFSNISGSEQKHMDEVLGLLTKYGVTDPANVQNGVFNNTDLQLLYNVLTAKSDSSLVDALEVGTLIEDLDIRDIEVNISRTDKLDLLNVYDKLKCGSRNHMRAFFGQLTNEGVTYKAQYLTQDELDEIIAGSHENCGG